MGKWRSIPNFMAIYPKAVEAFQHKNPKCQTRGGFDGIHTWIISEHNFVPIHPAYAEIFLRISEKWRWSCKKCHSISKSLRFILWRPSLISFSGCQILPFWHILCMSGSDAPGFNVTPMATHPRSGFACHPQMLKGRLWALHTDTKGYLVCLGETQGAHDKVVVYDELGREWVGGPWTLEENIMAKSQGEKYSSLGIKWMNTNDWVQINVL